MRKFASILFVIFVSSWAVDAQRATRTVTNADLSKFRDRRLAADQEYRDNYQRLGMPSPEELAEMRERDMDARLQLAEQLRRARLEKERLELDRQRLRMDAERLALDREARESEIVYSPGYGGFYGGGFGYSDYGYDGRFRGRRPPVGYPYYPSYRANPGGVIFEPGGRSGNAWTPTPPVVTGPAWRRPGIFIGPIPRPRP